ncbi:MAG: virulence factor SrfB [Kiritimatiellae bacterium]|nr:virulence factor SrfB [Kiritimatiellia bacterium]
MTVDGRSSASRSGDRPDPNRAVAQKYEALNYQYERVPAGYIDCVLSIDLGNTRTVALIADNVNGGGVGAVGSAVFQLPMRWSCKDAGRPVEGAFASALSLSRSVDDVENHAVSGEGGSLSFVKLGPFAEFNNRETALRRHAADGRYTISSPKRYFWDEDPSVERWISAIRSTCDGHPTVGDYWLEGDLAKAMADTHDGVDASHLPVSDMLGAMVVEIYEQAVRYIGSQEFIGLAGGALPRRIVRIHVTYPSTLLPRELGVYRNQLCKGLQCYQGLFVRPHQVLLESEIDEASSVLAVYAYSEIQKVNSASLWLRTIGRESSLGHQARIAVIDVGGGTTDLTIAQIEAAAADARGNPYKASMDSLYRDGVNNAGDAFMFKFLELYVKARGFKAIVDAFGANSDDVKRRYAQSENAAEVRRLTQTFWFPLALKVAESCDAIVGGYPAGNYPDAVLGQSIDFNDENNSWIKVWQDIVGGPARDVRSITIPIDRATVDAYVQAAETVFRRDATAFGKAIVAYETDVLVFSGKTAEFAAVRKVFSDRIALPPSSIVQMNDFKVGRWCKLTDASGRIADSKVATALGGALYTLRSYMPINLEFHDRSMGVGCDWGIVSGDNIAFATSLFPEGELRCTIPLVSRRMLLARRMRMSRSAILSYELRVRAAALKSKGELGADVQVTLSRNDVDTSLSVAACSGHFQNGIEVTLSDIECRLCTINGDFAMDRIMDL